MAAICGLKSDISRGQRSATADIPHLARSSQKLCRYQERHRVLPPAVRQRTLFGAVGVHDENLTVLLERVVVECRLVAEAVDAAVPHDATIPRPNCMTIARAVRGDPQQIGSIWADCKAIEIDVVDLACEQDAAAIRGPTRQVVVARCQRPNRAGFDIEDTKPKIALAPNAIDDVLSVCGIARKARMSLTVGQRFQTAAVALNAHDRGFLSVALLKPVADPEGKPLAIG